MKKGWFDGSSNTARSNVHTLGWNGNAQFSGSLKIGGTKFDEGLSIATEEYVDDKIANINVNGGQLVWSTF